MTSALGSGSVVMGTGIVSIALALDGRPVASDVVLVAGVVAWGAIAALVVRDLIRDSTTLRDHARAPAALGVVAASAVLGSRLALDGRRELPLILLAIAVVSWCALMPSVAAGGNLTRTGSSFMLTVAAQALASLAALCADAERARWLSYVAVVFCAVGLLLYPLIVARFDARELRDGAGDQWVAGGALAISALAICAVSVSDSRLGTLSAAAPALNGVAVGIWIAGVIWLVPLLAAELRWPRLRYDPRRWSTLFPVGMYAASGLEVSRVCGLGAAGSFARVWTWIAVVLWVVLSAGLLLRVRHWRPGRPGLYFQTRT